MDTGDKNYYEILEASPDSSSDEIYKCYLQAKNAYSQDSIALYSLMTKKECEEVLDAVEEAYSILSDPEKRARYNEARGITKVGSGTQGGAETSESPMPEKNTYKKAMSTPAHQPMSKIVAQKRFSLDYIFDPEFEKEIEKMSDFSGADLKKIREYKNVNLERMSDMTKVSKTYLRNIENEDMTNLPALVYVRGFVYQYAKCLKLNPDMVATSYIHKIKNSGGKE